MLDAHRQSTGTDPSACRERRGRHSLHAALRALARQVANRAGYSFEEAYRGVRGLLYLHGDLTAVESAVSEFIRCSAPASGRCHGDSRTGLQLNVSGETS
ncbi:MAG: hypothetical protein AB7Q97_16705 [Gammaproteobacteria bacterium]